MEPAAPAALPEDDLALGEVESDPAFVFPPRAPLVGGPPMQRSSGAASGALHSARWTLTDRPGVDMRTMSADAVAALGRVFVILFGVGDQASDSEGIYSLRSFSRDGLPQETIIVFEGEEDAIRYAGLLEATMDHMPVVCSIPPTELVDFCLDAGYQCRLEPQGSLLIPPDYNVTCTDWERATKLRQGEFLVLDSEPTCLTSSSTSSSSPAPGHEGAATANPADVPSTSGTLASVSPTRPGGPNSSSMAKFHPSFSDEELGALRSRLEALLPLAADSSSASATSTSAPSPPAGLGVRGDGGGLPPAGSSASA